MDDEMDPEASTERGRVGPLGEEAIAEAEASGERPEDAGGAGEGGAGGTDRSSHGAIPGRGDDLSVISDTDVPGTAG